MKYRNQSRVSRIFGSPIALVAFIIMLFILIKADRNIAAKAALGRKTLAQSQLELNKLQAHKDQLTSNINRLSDDAGIEAELRSKYHAVEDGESVAVIVGDATATEPLQTSSSTDTVAERSWFERLGSYIGLW